ncbi:hypothetical protein PHYPSEUDO_004951 [Phytophthora pseudosyringae]|uniref:Uncharacterized protein n=1 Tax=Phytophthora pseudosyringae TaxID=221518 RepID=A0A8T1WDF6_9STRA|nr:hypothetical protein PHYPSEUDO_004951 [Phytophthora pseudosyringae]
MTRESDDTTPTVSKETHGANMAGVDLNRPIPPHTTMSSEVEDVTMDGEPWTAIVAHAVAEPPIRASSGRRLIRTTPAKSKATADVQAPETAPDEPVQGASRSLPPDGEAIHVGPTMRIGLDVFMDGSRYSNTTMLPISNTTVDTSSFIFLAVS